MRVMEHLAGMPAQTMTPPGDIYCPRSAECRSLREDNMKAALRTKFVREPYRGFLLSTGARPLGEIGTDDFGVNGGNLLGSWLVELRSAMRKEEEETLSVPWL